MAPTTDTLHTDEIAKFFDRRALDYDSEYVASTPGGYALRKRREKVLALLGRLEGRVLDVGCGPGPMAEDILSLGCEFYGVDNSEQMLEIARRKYRNIGRATFIHGSASSLPWEDESFEAVICMGVIDMLADATSAIREMVRVLKPGGLLIVTFTNRRSPYSWWKKEVFYPTLGFGDKAWRLCSPRRRSAPLPPEGGRRTLYTQHEFVTILQRYGAEVQHMVGYYFNVCLSPLDEICPKLALSVMTKLEERNAFSYWAACGFVVQASKTKERLA